MTEKEALARLLGGITGTFSKDELEYELKEWAIKYVVKHIYSRDMVINYGVKRISEKG